MKIEDIDKSFDFVNTTFKITLLTICMLSLTQCKEDDDQPDKQNYGAEYFECKVNGVEFKSKSTPHCDGRYFNYYPEAYLGMPEGLMTFYGRNCTDYEVVGIRINGIFINDNYVSFMEPTVVDSAYPYYSIKNSLGQIVTYENVLDGEMEIEQFIPRADGSSPYGTIRGTFNFIVTDANAVDTFRITEGRFRFDVQQIF